jgi:hypothetical protein
MDGFVNAAGGTVPKVTFEMPPDGAPTRSTLFALAGVDENCKPIAPNDAMSGPIK